MEVSDIMSKHGLASPFSPWKQIDVGTEFRHVFKFGITILQSLLKYLAGRLLRGKEMCGQYRDGGIQVFLWDEQDGDGTFV